MTLGDDNLASYYNLCFHLMHIHKWNLSDIENMYPYELEAYKLLLINHLNELKKETR